MTVHLPVIQSTAALTTFCAARIDGPDGVHLWIDGNQKISGWDPKPNAFSLVQIDDCPGSTPTCRASCYVHGLEANAKATHDLYRHNSQTIRTILESAHTLQWADLVASWITDNCANIGFRWHVSGDLFSLEYAEWVAMVVYLSPTVRHWIYTRSFQYAHVFEGLDNIAVNLSADKDNFEEAFEWQTALARHRGQQTRICYMFTDRTCESAEHLIDLPDGSVIFPDYKFRGGRSESPAAQRASSNWYQALDGENRRMVCPVDFYGKSEKIRCGPCSKCLEAP